MKNSKSRAEEKDFATKLEELRAEAEEEKGRSESETAKVGEEADAGEEAKAVEEAKSEEATAEEEELSVKYLRLAADFQNYRRRVDKEKNDIYAYGNEKIMTGLLAVVDNFDRALAVETTDEKLQKGMTMIFEQLMGVLAESGLEEIPALKEEFDPNFHHAVQTENSEGYKNGQITTVLQKGYMLNKKVIRPSMVIVAE